MIRQLRVVIVFGVFLLPPAPSRSQPSQTLYRVVSSGAELQALFARPVDSLVVQLQPGTYRLTGTQFVDSTCGNCEDPSTPVPATVGLHLSGAYIRLVGPHDRSAIIYTNAGYGLFFDGCADGAVENVTITGGVRDTAGAATDAAIVVKNSTVVVRNNRIVGNIGDSSVVRNTVVGVMGIAGREGARMTIVGNEIIRNSWDGIALYRGAEATIEDNIVDGVDKATGAFVGGGRGVGIGVTWDGIATIRNNLVKRYWKGIGLFVDAVGTVENNIVEDIVTWGISLWDAGKGAPIGRIEGNIVYNVGACGASITRSSVAGDGGGFTRNVIVKSGQNPRYDAPDYYCAQCALDLHAVPASFRVADNLFHNNRRAAEDLPDFDVDRAAFLKELQERLNGFSTNTFFSQSDFAREFGLVGRR
jgi:parallel beta-helix repeat protein